MRDKILLLSELEEYQLKSVKFLLEYSIANDLNDSIEKIEDTICYENSTTEEVAKNWLEQCYDLDSMPTIITSKEKGDSLDKNH